MRALSQTDCLSLWESGQGLHPLDQGLLAVYTAFPNARSESIADWPLGKRNRALAELRCACFGQWVRGWTACEQCEDRLEFEVDGNALCESSVPDCDRRIDIDGTVFRLPSSRDLARIAGEHDPSMAAMRLLQFCVVATPDGDDVGHSRAMLQWTEEELDGIGDCMAQADPLAEIMLHFDCPTCGHSFDQSLDLASFLWTELEGRAKRLLLDVHILAHAYGWSELEILSLSSTRRNFYLEMVRA